MLSSARYGFRASQLWLAKRFLATTAPQSPSGRHDFLPTSHSEITPDLHFFNSVLGDDKQIPTYRLLGKDGKPVEGAKMPALKEDFCRRLYVLVGLRYCNANLIRLQVRDYVKATHHGQRIV